MDNTMMIAMQTQRVMQRRMDIAAQNMANISTAGFKADMLVLQEESERPAQSQDRPQDVRFVRDIGVAHDLRQGTLRVTGNPLDVALEGPGFFIIEGPNGPLYTRDGAFTLNGAGQLVTSDGRPVLSDGGAPIVFDPQGEQPTIGRDGAISLAGVQVSRLGVASFERPGALERVGDNLWSAGDQPPQAFEGVVTQGALEDSNVVPVLELTNLIQIARAYESASRLVTETDQLRQRAIDRLGRVN